VHKFNLKSICKR